MIICSDTNIWFDFESINGLNLPFLLQNDYFICNVTYQDEISYDVKIRKIVELHKLKITELEIGEAILSETLRNKYPNISIQDSFALAIAINRKWVLLSGDKALSNAAKDEKIECHGTIWICDQLVNNNLISQKNIILL